MPLITQGPLCTLIARPHFLVPGRQRTVSTSKGCNQWLSLAKTLLKVALDGGNCLLVARTNMCGWAISCRYVGVVRFVFRVLGVFSDD